MAAVVSAARAHTLQPGWRKPLPVLIRVNGKPEEAWRINMMPVGDGSFYLYLHEIVRTASGTGVGDRIQVEVAFDEAYQGGPVHPMPAWFEQALDRSPAAAENWEALSPSRERNLEKAMLVLSGKKGRFMARAWEQGR